MALLRRNRPRRAKPRRLFNPGRWFQERPGAFLRRLGKGGRASFRRLWQTPLASLLTILVLAITLALPASFHALIQNARQPLASLETTGEISLFLKPELSNEAGRKLAGRLQHNPALTRVTLVTKEEGLKELLNYSGFADALAALDSNPLPAVIIIQPAQRDAAAMAGLLGMLKTLPEADTLQFDNEWLEKLQTLLDVASRATAAFGLLLGVGVLFIVGNTIRLELQHRRPEIAVLRLLGATPGYIRRPFLLTGGWYAVLGAALAWLLANALLLGLSLPVNQLAALYGSSFRLAFLGVTDLVLLLIFAAMLGVSGAWIVVAYGLREIAAD